MASRQHSSRAATLPPRVTPPTTTNQSSSPSTTRGFLGRIKRKLRFKTRDNEFDFGEHFNVEGVYFRRKSGDLTNENGTQSKEHGNYSGRVDITRNTPDRPKPSSKLSNTPDRPKPSSKLSNTPDRPKPSSKLSKFRLGIRSSKSMKSDKNKQGNDLRDDDVVPTLNTLLIDDLQNDCLANDTNIIDLDVCKQAPCLEDIDPGYETLDDVRQKMKDIQKSKSTNQQPVLDLREGSKASGHKRSYSSGAPAPQSSHHHDNRLSMSSHVDSYGRSPIHQASLMFTSDQGESFNINSSPVLYQELDTNDSAYAQTHRRCHSEQFQLQPELVLIEKYSETIVDSKADNPEEDISCKFQEFSGQDVDIKSDNDIIDSVSDNSRTDVTNIYACPDVLAKKNIHHSGQPVGLEICKVDSQSSSVPRVNDSELCDSEDIAPPIPDRNYNVASIDDLLNIESPSPSSDVLGLKSENNSYDDKCNALMKIGDICGMDLRLQHGVDLESNSPVDMGSVYESVEDCKKELVRKNLVEEEQCSDHRLSDVPTWSGISSASSDTIYESVDDCKSNDKIASSVIVKQNVVIDFKGDKDCELHAENSENMLNGFDKFVDEMQHIKCEQSSNEREENHFTSSIATSQTAEDDGKSIAHEKLSLQRPKNIWSFKKEHLYAEINDLNNEKEIRKSEQLRHEILNEKSISSERTEKDLDLLKLNKDLDIVNRSDEKNDQYRSHECSTAVIKQSSDLPAETVTHCTDLPAETVTHCTDLPTEGNTCLEDDIGHRSSLWGKKHPDLTMFTHNNVIVSNSHENNQQEPECVLQSAKNNTLTGHCQINCTHNQDLFMEKSDSEVKLKENTIQASCVYSLHMLHSASAEELTPNRKNDCVDSTSVSIPSHSISAYVKTYNPNNVSAISQQSHNITSNFTSNILQCHKTKTNFLTCSNDKSQNPSCRNDSDFSDLLDKSVKHSSCVLYSNDDTQLYPWLSRPNDLHGRNIQESVSRDIPDEVPYRDVMFNTNLHVCTEEDSVHIPQLPTPTSSSTLYYGGMEASLELPSGQQIESSSFEENAKTSNCETALSYCHSSLADEGDLNICPTTGHTMNKCGTKVYDPGDHTERNSSELHTINSLTPDDINAASCSSPMNKQRKVNPCDDLDSNVRHMTKLKPLSTIVNRGQLEDLGMFTRERESEFSLGSSNTDDSLDTLCESRHQITSYEDTADMVLENLRNDNLCEGFSSTENLLNCNSDFDLHLCVAASCENTAQVPNHSPKNSSEIPKDARTSDSVKLKYLKSDDENKDIESEKNVSHTVCINKTKLDDADPCREIQTLKSTEISTSPETSLTSSQATANVSKNRLPCSYYDDNEPVHMSLSDLYRNRFPTDNEANITDVPLRDRTGESGGNLRKSASCNDGGSIVIPSRSERRRKVQSSIDDRPPAIIPRVKSETESECRKDFWESMRQLKDCGWYWGPMSWEEAEWKLVNKPDGSFLVRDSSNDRYLLSLSFNTNGHVHHTRIEHHKGKFSFWSQPDSLGKDTIQEFIEKCIRNSQNGQFLYFIRPSGPGAPPIAVHLLYPVSRFKQMQSLQHMCRFNIVQRVRRDHIDKLPIPSRIKDYLKESQYYVEYLDD